MKFFKIGLLLWILISICIVAYHSLLYGMPMEWSQQLKNEVTERVTNSLGSILVLGFICLIFTDND